VTPRISILIATYRRPDGLDRLLRSFEAMVPETPAYEIVVVDNDLRETASEVVSRFAASGLPVRYVREPVKNIARARNAGIEASRAELCAFIDDDEIADPRWLVALTNALDATPAEGAFGPVLPSFEPEAPPWIRDLGFHGANPAACGTSVPWHGTYTGNAMIRRDVLGDDRFDERLGLTGGEDVELFTRLTGRGARFVRAEDATVVEPVGRDRTTLRWIARRAYRNGITLAIVGRRHPAFTGPPRSAWRSGRKALTCGVRALLRRGSRLEFAREVVRACEHAGIVVGSFGGTVREYD
jgi:succinoglycan biosynthesis protein ExoM